MLRIALSRPSPAWARAEPGLGPLLRRAARHALARGLAAGGLHARGRAVELDLTLADDAAVHLLNREHRGRDQPTNVLSFPQLEPDALAGALADAAHRPGGDASLPVMLGDVILAFETVSAEAARDGKPRAHHAAHLVVHGVLHLIGFDHMDEREATAMETLETAILAGLGIADPYAGYDGSTRTDRHPAGTEA